MSAMMGLTTRLRLARTLVRVGLRGTPEETAGLTRQLVDKRADLVVIEQAAARPADLARGFRAAAAQRGTHVILGLADDQKVARQVHADLFAIGATGTPGRGHQWGLCVATVDDPASLQRWMTDDQVNALVVGPDLVERACQIAPPTRPTSKPWFCQVTDLDAARQALAAGARRFACQAPPVELAAQLRDLLLEPWRTEMEALTFAAMQADRMITRATGFSRQPGRPADRLAEGESWVVPTDD